MRAVARWLSCLRGSVAWLLLPRGLHWCLMSVLMPWFRYGPRRVLGYDRFPRFQAGNEKSWVFLKCWHSSAVGASCFYPSVVVAEASKKKKGGGGSDCALVWGSWTNVVCLFDCFLSFL